jgi:spermidine synthase
VPAKPSPSILALPSALRIYLYVTATITGAIVLVVEILGAKMLTPFFGSSHFVWTAQIAITLLALAAGYYLGGWAADRYRNPALVYAALTLAAACLALTVLMRSLDLAVGSIVASLGLFFVPLTLLAAVGPYFVRTLTASVDNVGRSVGRLTALGTLGSAAGVLITSYILVPHVRDSVSMLGTAAALLALSAGYFLAWGIDEKGRGVAVAGVVATAILGYSGLRREAADLPRQHVEVARANSHFGTMQVLESRDGRRRLYLNDLLVQNTYDPIERRSMSMFTYALYYLSRGYARELRTALCLGMGVGIAPGLLAADGVKVDVVEINPAVVPLAEQWFDFNRSAVNLVIDDARHFLRVATNRYDTIQLDAFLGDSSPSHLMTREAFQDIRALLNPGGVLVINSFASFVEDRDFFGNALFATLSDVFEEVAIHASPGGNTLFVASNEPLKEFEQPPNLSHVHPLCRADLAAALAAPMSPLPKPGLVLTDDYNPVDYFDAENRERTRRILAQSVEMW